MPKYEVTTVDNETITYSITDEDDQSLVRCCVVEIGQYGDMAVINPFTGKRLWVGASVDMTDNFYEATRRLMKVAEELKFLGDPSNS